MEHGSTRRKAKEYIEDLVYCEFLELDDEGFLWLKDKSYKEKTEKAEKEADEILNDA